MVATRDLARLYNAETKRINEVVKNNMDKFSDRFIIIDNILCHLGASSKDLGKKCFGINKIEDTEYLDKIIKLIKN